MKRIIYIITLLLLFIPQCMRGESAKITFDNSLHNFEAIAEEGGCVTHNFTFTNTGDSPLIIMDVSTNCGCTTAQYPQAPIAAGNQGTIVITFDPKGNPGEFAKEIIVKSNASKRRTKLRIKGYVIPQQ